MKIEKQNKSIIIIFQYKGYVCSTKTLFKAPHNKIYRIIFNRYITGHENESVIDVNSGDTTNCTEKIRRIYTVGWNYRRKGPNTIGKRSTVGIIFFFWGGGGGPKKK
jgi:hypothetical protein